MDVASQLKVRSYWIRMGPDPESGVLIRRACEDTQERRPCDHRGGDWSGVSLNPGTPRIASDYRKLEEARKGHLLESLEMGGPADTLTWERISICARSHPVCGTSLGQPQETYTAPFSRFLELTQLSQLQALHVLFLLPGTLSQHLIPRGFFLSHPHVTHPAPA